MVETKILNVSSCFPGQCGAPLVCSAASRRPRAAAARAARLPGAARAPDARARAERGLVEPQVRALRRRRVAARPAARDVALLRAVRAHRRARRRRRDPPRRRGGARATRTTASRCPTTRPRSAASSSCSPRAGGPIARADEIGVVGHRVVHGGAELTAPRVVDDDVEAQIEACVPLAPLHNPANLLGIRTARAQFGRAPHVAVFDTAFHATMPPESYAYALPKELREARGVRKYGFHGTSYSYVLGGRLSSLSAARRRAARGALPPGQRREHVLRRAGACVDTTMGLTPLEGLVMGTRARRRRRGRADVPIARARRGTRAEARSTRALCLLDGTYRASSATPPARSTRCSTSGRGCSGCAATPTGARSRRRPTAATRTRGSRATSSSSASASTSARTSSRRRARRLFSLSSRRAETPNPRERRAPGRAARRARRRALVFSGGIGENDDAQRAAVMPRARAARRRDRRDDATRAHDGGAVDRASVRTMVVPTDETLRSRSRLNRSTRPGCTAPRPPRPRPRRRARGSRARPSPSRASRRRRGRRPTRPPRAPTPRAAPATRAPPSATARRAARQRAHGRERLGHDARRGRAHVVGARARARPTASATSACSRSASRPTRSSRSCAARASSRRAVSRTCRSTRTSA